MHRLTAPAAQSSNEQTRSRSQQFPMQLSAALGNQHALRRIEKHTGPGQKLPSHIRAKMETALGYDFASVSFQEHQIAADLGAEAFSQGRNIVFAPGKFDASSQSGQALIAHELAHVTQQATGAASAPQARGNSLVTDQSLEQQADRDGQRAASFTGASSMRQVQDLPQHYGGGILQGKFLSSWFTKRKAKKAQQRKEQAMVDQVVSDHLGSFSLQDKKGRQDQKASVNAVKALWESNARFLSDAEFQALHALSFHPMGVQWLHDHQFYTIHELLPLYRTALDGQEGPTQAQGESDDDFHQRVLEFYSDDSQSQFISGENPVFKRYETLPKGARIQLAYIAHQNEGSMQDTLYAYKAEAVVAQLIARSEVPGEGPEAARQFREETAYARDEAVWSDVLTEQTSQQVKQSALTMGMTEDQSQDMASKYAYSTQLLKRLFLLMQVGLGYTADQDNPLSDWPSQIAAALSHSGRVILRLPKAKTKAEEGFGHPLMRYLFAGGGDDSLQAATQGGMFNRHGGTHNITFQDQPEGGQRMKEGRGITKGFFASLFNPGYTHYGLDAALQGSAGATALSGDVIMPNGKCGHLYIGVKLPTVKSEGAVQIGAEGDRYGAGVSSFGHVHNLKGAGEEIKNAGGQKSDLMGDIAGGRIIDTRKMGDLWETRLRQMEGLLKAQGQLSGKSYEQMLSGRQAGGSTYMQTGVDQFDVPDPTTREEYNLLLDILLNSSLDLPPSYRRKIEHAIWRGQNAGVNLS